MSIYLINVIGNTVEECMEITDSYEYAQIHSILLDYNPFLVEEGFHGIYGVGRYDVYVQAENEDDAKHQAVEAVADEKMIQLGRRGYYGS